MKVRLRDTVEVFAARDGDVFLSHGGARAELVIRSADPRSRDLLELIRDAPREPGELAGALAARGHDAPADEVAATLRELVDRRLAEDTTLAAGSGLPPGRLERFDRQLAYFADAHGQRAAYAKQRALGAAHVVVLGCGGLGSWTAAGLACSGVGRLTLVDPDAVEPSNLNRQILFRARDVGASKVETAARWLRAFDPELEVEPLARRVDGVEAAACLMTACDLVVLTADTPVYAISRWVDEACRRRGIPWISGGQFPPTIRVGPLLAPGATPCWACLEAEARRTHPRYDELVAARQARAVRAATTGPASGVVGSLLAHEAVAWLAGLHPPATLGASLVLDLATLTVRRSELTASPDCSRCAPA